MRCTTPPAPRATPPTGGPPVPVSPRGLAAASARVPDPRRAKSVTYALPAIRALAVAAIPSSHLSVLAIAEWGEGQAPDLLRAVGVPDGRAP